MPYGDLKVHKKFKQRHKNLLNQQLLAEILTNKSMRSENCCKSMAKYSPK